MTILGYGWFLLGNTISYNRKTTAFKAIHKEDINDFNKYM